MKGKLIKRLAAIIGLLFVLCLMTGCWSRRELNELSIVTAMGIDRGTGNKEPYQVSLQLVNSSAFGHGQGGGEEVTPVTIFSASGDTIFEAIRKLSITTPRRAYFSHTRVIVLGESLARYGIRDIVDFLDRSGEIRKNIPIVVAKGENAKAMISLLDPLTKIPALKITGALENNKNIWGSSKDTTLKDLISDLTSESSDPYLGIVKMSGQKETADKLENVKQSRLPANLELTGLAVFKKDKLEGWLDEREGRGLGWINDEIEGTVVNVPGPKTDEKISVDIIHSSTKREAVFTEEGPYIKVEVSQEGNIADSQSAIDFSKISVIEQIQSKVNVVTKSEMEATLSKVQEMGTDILGFGEVINRSNPKMWKELKKDWPEHFRDIPVQFEVKTQIRRSGIRTKTPLEKI